MISDDEVVDALLDKYSRKLELDDNPEPWHEEIEEFHQESIRDQAKRIYEDDRKNRVAKLLSMFPWLPTKIEHKRLKTTINYIDKDDNDNCFEFFYFWPEDHLCYNPKFKCEHLIPNLPKNGMEFKDLAQLGDILLFEEEQQKELKCETCNPKWEPGQLLRGESKW